MNNKGNIVTPNISKYSVFEHIGENNHGGRLAVGCLNDLKPVMVREGEDTVKCLTVENTFEENSY